MPHCGIGLARLACFAVLSSLAGQASAEVATSSRRAHAWSGRPAGKPAYLWLWYPEQSNLANTEEGPYCSRLSVPAFSCTFGKNVDDCKRQVQSYLDAWYADFNLVFTFSRPNADYYTIVVTNDGSWCPNPPEDGIAGIAYHSNTCDDLTGYAGYVFSCDNAHDCATVIAHEHAHMVGLEHTVSITDVMNRKVQANAKGFDNEDNNATVDDVCDYLTQDSYQRMLSALGPWPGGVKPSPLADLPDAGAADAATDGSAHADAASSGSPIGPGTGTFIDGGTITAVGGFDAIVRPPLPTIDAGDVIAQSKGGCSLAGAPETAASALFALLCLLFAALTRARGRCPAARRARPAGEPLPCAAPARSPSAARARGR